MDIDYKQKYFQLQSVCKKQEKTIANLQLQIRQRCQSYLLHSSRYKKTQHHEQQTNEENLTLSSPIIKVNNLEESVVESTDWINKPENENLIRSGFSSQSAISKQIPENFTISAQISIFEKFSKQKEVQITEPKIDNGQIVRGFKERIVKIQQQKNKSVKDNQKLNQQLNVFRKKNIQLQRKIQAAAKQQKKTKGKTQQLSQIQSIVIQIFNQLRKKHSDNLQNEDFQNFAALKMNNKLEQIYKLAKRQISNQKVQDQVIKQLVKQDKFCQSQQFVELQIKKTYRIQMMLSQQEIQCKIEQFQPRLQNVLQITISPNTQIKASLQKEQSGNLAQKLQAQISRISEEKKLQLEKIQLQIKHSYQTQFQKKNQQFLQQIAELKKQLEVEKTSLQALKQQNDRLQEQNITLITDNMSKQNRISNLQLLIEKMKRQTQELSMQKSKLKDQLQHLKLIQSDFQQTKIQLDKSRSIIDDLQSSKIAKQLRDMKQSLTQSRKVEKNDTLNNSPFKIVEKLQEPYYVQQQLQNDPNNEYVKRSFIRKKIVRRNLSATAYRVVSKSKEQVNDIIKNKISQLTERSLQKSQRLKQSHRLKQTPKKQQLKSSLKDQRISELSEENRDSNYFNNVEQVVKVIEVTTKTPREQIVTTKITSKNVDQNLSFRKRNQT